MYFLRTPVVFSDIRQKSLPVQEKSSCVIQNLWHISISCADNKTLLIQLYACLLWQMYGYHHKVLFFTSKQKQFIMYVLQWSNDVIGIPWKMIALQVYWRQITHIRFWFLALNLQLFCKDYMWCYIYFL